MEVGDERPLAVAGSRRAQGLAWVLGPAALAVLLVALGFASSLTSVLAVADAAAGGCLWVSGVALVWLRWPVVLAASAAGLRVAVPRFAIYRVRQVAFFAAWSAIDDVRLEYEVVSRPDHTGSGRKARGHTLVVETAGQTHRVPWVFEGDAARVVETVRELVGSWRTRQAE